MSYDLTNEAELKEYIENLGIEYRFGCYSEKNPEVCHLLGEYMDSIKGDYVKAGKIYKSNCDDYKHPRSCHAFGSYAFVGKGQEKENHDVAYEYFAKGCNLDFPDSCYNAGLLCVSNSPRLQREKDYTKGLEFLDRSCNMQHDPSCYYLSGLYMSGTKDQVIPKDMNLAFKYSVKACDLDNMYACSNLSIMYKRGEGVEKNEELSEKMKKKALDLQEQVKSNFTVEFARGSKS